MEAESTQSTETYLKIMAWLHANRKALVIGVGLAAGIALVLAFLAWQKTQTDSEADAQLLNLPVGSFSRDQTAPASPAPFLDLAQKYPDTSAGEYAELLGAAELFTEGKYPEAHQAFSQFADKYPDSPLLSQAKVGLAASLEGEGKISEAAQAYQQILSAYSTEPNIVSPVKLTLARLDEQLNKPEQALNYYVELARNNNPYDPWAGEARERGELLLAKHPELRKAPPEATGSQPAGLNLYSHPSAGGAPSSAPKQ
jgi:predicted negative regulator of RcsB-dependent stress response